MPELEQDDVYITPGTAAHMLGRGMTTSGVWRLAQKGLIRYKVRKGRMRWYNRADVQAERARRDERKAV